MPRVSVHASDEYDEEPVNDAEASFDDGVDEAYEDEPRQERRRRKKRRRSGGSQVDVEIEREVTKRAMIEAVTRLLVVILYMGFTLVREREAGVVALDPEDDDLGPEDDWAEV